MAKAKKFKIDKHSLTPKHQKLSEKDKKELFEKYNINEQALPKILKTDSAITSLGIKPGDVIKITKESITAGEAVFYRVVTNV